MKLDELLTIAASDNAPNICLDCRLVKPGDIFIAIKGTVYDGHDFIEAAINNGAKFIVTQQPCDCENAGAIVVDDTAHSAAILAQAKYNNPASKLINLAVTGTNGKTTVAFLVQSIIKAANQKCGLISTIIYDTGQTTFPATLTTPDCVTIAKTQHQMVEAGSKFMAIEASSHALFQNRLANINFKAAAFTNLTGDHLDYHETEENYLAAKTLLFQKMSPGQTAVLNKQSPHAEKIAKNTNTDILWYAVDEPADITAHIESMDITQTTFSLEYAGQNQKIKTSLPGRYNVSNCLAAAGLCLAAGIDLETIAKGVFALKAIPGRLEKVEGFNDFSVLVDYAHTDDALKNVLSVLKPLCEGKLILVFGCGGDRDKTKRARMAAVAEQLADIIIVTSDNPRTEHPAIIIGEIALGFENMAAQKIINEIDRKKAIKIAIEKANAGDIVLIAGKGHETYQIIGDKKNDFSDSEVAKKYLMK